MICKLTILINLYHNNIDFCPRHQCFVYDRIAKTCWKLIFVGGWKMNYNMAKRLCHDSSSELAILDTEKKISQVHKVISEVSGEMFSVNIIGKYILQTL